MYRRCRCSYSICIVLKIEHSKYDLVVNYMTVVARANLACLFIHKCLCIGIHFMYRYTICTVCVCVCVYSLSHSLDNIHMQIARIGPTTSEDMQTSGLTVTVCPSASQLARLATGSNDRGGLTQPTSDKTVKDIRCSTRGWVRIQ